MAKETYTYLSKDGKTNIYVTEWIPEIDPQQIKGILQICHGMKEYVGRYENFALYLNEAGFVVLGNDHLGHGRSVVDEAHHGYFGEPDGHVLVVEDVHTLRNMTQKKYPGVPYFILGHSMGSFIARYYIQNYGEGLSGAIIMGTGSMAGPVLAIGGQVLKGQLKKFGSMSPSDKLDQLSLGNYNKRIQPLRTENDWLTRDEKIVDAYNADPWCTYRFKINGYACLFAWINYIQKKQNIDRIPKDLPVYFVSGAEDPVGSYGKGVKQAEEGFKAVGMKEVSIRLYEGMRHEVLNELGHEQVYGDIKTWLQSHLKN